MRGERRKEGGRVKEERVVEGVGGGECEGRVRGARTVGVNETAPKRSSCPLELFIISKGRR